MSTLTDFMLDGAPTEIELIGKRLSGTVKVRFGRNAQLQPTIRFGGDMFNVSGLGDVECNSIPCQVAGLDFYRVDGEWRCTAYRNIRRRTLNPHTEYPPDKTSAVILAACAAECPRLWEQFEQSGAPEQLGVREGDTYSDAVRFAEGVRQLENDLRIVRRFAEIAEAARQGTLTVVDREHSPESLPDRIRWVEPHHDTLAHTVIHSYGGRSVVGAVLDLGVVIGYAVDVSDNPRQPTTHRGPLLVPVELART